MKNFPVTLLVLILIPFLSFAQILDPIKWSYQIEQSSPGEATLVMTAHIDKKWHLYSQDIPKDKEGPIPTSFDFKKSNNYQLVGKVSEPKGIEENDPMFDMVIKFFADKAVFKQKIRILSRNDFTVSGSLEYMCCDDKQCLPPTEVAFSFGIKGNPAATQMTTTQTVIQDKVKDAALEVARKSDSVSKKQDQAQLSATAADTAADQSLFWFFLISFLAGHSSCTTPKTKARHGWKPLFTGCRSSLFIQ
jgi:thiol:disulfide interchange protein